MEDIIKSFYLKLTSNKDNEKLLLGKDCYDDVRNVINKVVKNTGFVLYAEMPLINEPFLDLTVCKIEKEKDKNDTEQGYSEFLDYQRSFKLNRFAFEYDLSKGNINKPHIVVFLPSNFKFTKEYLDNSLKYLNSENISNKVYKFISNLPKNSYLAYYGSYKERESKPFRLTIKLKDTKKYFEDHSLLIKDLETLGYKHFKDNMFEVFDLFFKNNETVEMCFDMDEKGLIDETIGLQVGTNGLKRDSLSPSKYKETSSYNYLNELKKMGLIDDRFNKLIDTIYSNEKETHSIHTIKIRYKKGTLLVPKIYTEFSYTN